MVCNELSIGKSLTGTLTNEPKGSSCGGKVKNLITPGRLTKALEVTKTLNGKPASMANGLWIEDRGVKIKPSQILRTPRIGIRYAKEWVDKKLQFILTKKSNLTVYPPGILDV